MPDPIDYATPPAPPGPKEGELYIVLLLFNVAGIIGGIFMLGLLSWLALDLRRVLVAAGMELLVFFGAAEICLVTITLCLKRSLRKYALLGLGVLIVCAIRYSVALFLGL